MWKSEYSVIIKRNTKPTQHHEPLVAITIYMTIPIPFMMPFTYIA